MKVERRIGADRCGFLEQHDAVAGLAARSLSAADRPGAIFNAEPPPGGTTKPFVSIVMTSERSFDIGQIRGDFGLGPRVQAAWTMVNRAPRSEQDRASPTK